LTRKERYIFTEEQKRKKEGFMNVLHGLQATADRVPQKVAFIDESRSITYRDFDLETTRLAYSFRNELNLKKGQRLILAVPNSIDSVIGMYGAFKAGLTVVPTNTMLKDFEIDHLLRDTRAPIIITTSDFIKQLPPKEKFNSLKYVVLEDDTKECFKNVQTHLLRDLIDAGKEEFEPLQPKPQDIAAIFYTSGSTGNRKGAMLSHKLVFDHSASIVQVLSMTEVDKHLVVLPMSHLFVQGVVVMPSILSGGTAFIVRHFDAEAVLSMIAKNKITMMAGVSTMYARMIEVPNAASFDLHSLRAVIAGAAALNPQVAKRFFEIFDIDILRSFGSSETGVIAITPPEGAKKHGSIGKAIPGISISIQDESGNQVPIGEPGELVVHRSCVMSGYLNLRKANEEGFRGDWYHTGDIARMDEDGYVYIVGRKKEMINTSGYSVFPKEVETIISKLDKVFEVAVVGLPDEERGEIVGAFIVPKNGELSEEAVLAYCKEHLGGYKVPRKILFLREMPTTPTGKIAKKVLYENYVETQSN